MPGWKETLLHLAARRDASRAVKKLVDTWDALLEPLDESGFKAVSLAAIRCSVSALRVLLQEYQARGRLEEALERSLFGAMDERRSLLFHCLGDFQVEEAMRLAATRVLVQEFNANCRTAYRGATYEISPVNLAVGKGLLSIVKFYILECGMPVDGPPDGMTTLQSAVMGELEEEDMLLMVEWLLEHGASLTVDHGEGSITAAQLAARKGKIRVASYLRRTERNQAKMMAAKQEEDTRKAAEAAEKAASDLLAELDLEEAATRRGGAGEKNTKKTGKGKKK